MTPTGQFTEYSLGSSSRPQGLVVGPDKNIWLAGQVLLLVPAALSMCDRRHLHWGLLLLLSSKRCLV